MSYYLKTVIFAVILTVFLTIMIMIFINTRKNPDVFQPQFLINTIQSDIDKNDQGFNLSKEIEELLKEKDYWLQIIDERGNVVYSVNADTGIPNKYSSLELVDIVSQSDRLPGYTVFMSGYAQDENYNLLLGCSSDNVRKIIYHSKGGVKDLIVQTIIIIVAISSVVITVVSLVFSKKVSRPIALIGDDIRKMSEGNEIVRHNKKEKGMFTDVFSQTEQLQCALNENKNARDKWISNISHDIKTPLATIKGYAELMSENEYALTDEEIKKYSNEILSSGNTIEGLVYELRLYQTLSEGKYKPKLSPINLFNLLSDCIDLSKVYISEKDDIKIECNDQTIITGDEKMLKRSFTNIICNAFVHNVEPVEVSVSAHDESEYVIISISDNGIGMKEDEVNHIFERYYRGMGSDKVKGTGLGLSIAKETIMSHKGNIKVDSTPGEGTVFTIALKKEI